MSSLDLAVIGNSSVAALVDAQARIVFASLPRLDSDPVFCSLLRGGDAAGAAAADGALSVELVDFKSSEQSYLDMVVGAPDEQDAEDLRALLEPL